MQPAGEPWCLGWRVWGFHKVATTPSVCTKCRSWWQAPQADACLSALTGSPAVLIMGAPSPLPILLFLRCPCSLQHMHNGCTALLGEGWERRVCVYVRPSLRLCAHPSTCCHCMLCESACRAWMCPWCATAAARVGGEETGRMSSHLSCLA